MPACKICIVLLAATALGGCGRSAAEMGPPPAPAVTVSLPIERDVIDSMDFTGRTAAIDSVKVRARVWGHLEKINFAEGAEVKKGEVLFVIDQRPYAAALARTEADVAQAEARIKRLEADQVRAVRLAKTGAISPQEQDKIEGDLSEARATLQGVVAARETAKLNLEHTEVRAPISGQISRALVTVGNLVESGETGGAVLTMIVSCNPVYAYFDVDDIALVKVRQLLKQAKQAQGDSKPLALADLPPVFLGLAQQPGYPHKGRVDFIDNQVDAGTGTLKVRAVFDDPDHELTPGLFARVRLPLGTPHPALLVSDRALETDQGQKVLYVVNHDEVVEKRRVALGGLHDGLREITSGLKAGEKVIVDGLQRIREGMTVAPNVVEMPTAETVQAARTAATSRS